MEDGLFTTKYALEEAPKLKIGALSRIQHWRNIRSKII
jgi:hypothetical protein